MSVANRPPSRKPFCDLAEDCEIQHTLSGLFTQAMASFSGGGLFFGRRSWMSQILCRASRAETSTQRSRMAASRPPAEPVPGRRRSLAARGEAA